MVNDGNILDIQQQRNTLNLMSEKASFILDAVNIQELNPSIQFINTVCQIKALEDEFLDKLQKRESLEDVNREVDEVNAQLF